MGFNVKTNPKLPECVIIKDLNAGTSTTYKVVGVTHSGSRGWEYQLQTLNAPRPGQVSRVCHAPEHTHSTCSRPVSAVTSGQRIEYLWERSK